MAIDPYIIDNMPNDPPPTADLTLRDGDMTLDLVYDGDSYVLALSIDGVSPEGEGTIVAVFDPTMDLATVLSIIMVARRATVAAGSTEAVTAAQALMAAMTEDTITE